MRHLLVCIMLSLILAFGLGIQDTGAQGHFTLDPTEGSISFKDGQKGQRPPAGKGVVADYRKGTEKGVDRREISRSTKKNKAIAHPPIRRRQSR